MTSTTSGWTAPTASVQAVRQSGHSGLSDTIPQPSSERSQTSRPGTAARISPFAAPRAVLSPSTRTRVVPSQRSVVVGSSTSVTVESSNAPVSPSNWGTVDGGGAGTQVVVVTSATVGSGRRSNSSASCSSTVGRADAAATPDRAMITTAPTPQAARRGRSAVAHPDPKRRGCSTNRIESSAAGSVTATVIAATAARGSSQFDWRKIWIGQDHR